MNRFYIKYILRNITYYVKNIWINAILKNDITLYKYGNQFKRIKRV